jgi:glycosyltransferase involved in cell wall biosynthesis
MTPTSITAVILTKNEARDLPLAIDSVAFCDRIVIVDSGSTDQTRDVAMEHHADVFTHVPPPPFRISDQRNWALENTAIATEWVLFLDADEAVPPQLAAALTKIAAAHDSAFDAYELTPRYIYWGKWLKRTQGYPNWHPRFLRASTVRYEGGVWEHFQKNTRVGRVREPYDHYANSKGFADWLTKHLRYAEWDADKIIRYLDEGDPNGLQTERKKLLRRLAARMWPLRPLARFLHMYIVRLGFLEGLPALNFCLLYFFYELMLVNLIVEKRRQRKGLPL